MKKRILVFGDFPEDWPYTRLILNRLSEDFELHYCVPSGLILDFKNFLNSFIPYGYTSKIITILLAFQALMLKGRLFEFIFVGFGGFGSIPNAYLLKKFFRTNLIYLSVVSRSLTNEFYKKSIPNLKKIYAVEKRRFELCDLVIFDTPMQLRYIVERMYDMPLESIEKNERFVCIPLIPDKKIFFYSKVPHKKILKVVWWGQVSQLHGVEFIFKAIKLCKKLPIEFTFLISEDIKTATGHDWDYWNDYLREANVVIVWWKYGITHTVQEINSLIQNCHICLGVFNFNDHLNTFYANKEMEAIFLNRLLITRYRLNSNEFFNGAAVEQVSNPQELALLLEKFLLGEVSVDNCRSIERIEREFDRAISSVFYKENE